MLDETGPLRKKSEEELALREASQAQHAQMMREIRDARKHGGARRSGEGPFNFTINAPHTVQSRGRNVAITIQTPKPSQSETAAGITATCALQASLVVDGSTYVQFTWGTINGIQPHGFTAGDATPFRLPAVSGSYYYATSKFNPATFLWIPLETKIISDISSTLVSGSVANTAYELLCSVGTSGSDLVLAGLDRCGNVAFSVCDIT